MGISGNLLTCLQEQELGNSYDSERQLLCNLGIKTSSSLETAIVYRGLFDILVAVNQKSGDIILSSASVEKLQELVFGNYAIPRDGNFIYEQDLISSIQYSVINDYIQKGKYHFVKISPKEKISSCFLCSLGTFKPYPDFKGYDVYTLSSVSNLVREYENALDRMYCKFRLKSDNSTIVCSRKRLPNGGKKLMSVPTPYCKLYAYDLSGAFIEIPIFDILSVEPYYTSQFESDISEGIVSIGGKNYTINRDILERYYGSSYYLLETQKVKERWALEDIMEGKLTTVEQVFHKYKFNRNVGFPVVRTFKDLVDYLVQSVESPDVHDSSKLTARVLSNVSLITSNKVSFYRTIKLSSIPEYKVVSVDKVLPKSVVIAGVSKDFGYQVSTAYVNVGSTIKDVCNKEFIRQFGSLIGTLEIYVDESNGTPLNLLGQTVLADHINAGDYVNNFNEYYEVLVDIMNANGVPWYSESTVKHLFINNLVRALKEDFRKRGIKEKEYIKDYGVFGVELCKFIRLVKSMPETKHKGYLVNTIRKYDNYDKALKIEIQQAYSENKQREGSLLGKLPFKVRVDKKVVYINLTEINHTIAVEWSINEDGSVALSDRYESV